MKHIKPGDTPFYTTNAILAYCLHLAGVPWYENNKPCKVLYSMAILQKFTDNNGKSLYKGVMNAQGQRWMLEEATKDAYKRQLRGHVEFVFQRIPRLQKLLKAYRDQENQLKEGTGYLHDLIAGIVTQFMDGEQDILTLRLACIMLKMRPGFMDLWTHQVPCMVIPNEGEVTREELPDGGYRINSPGFRIMSVNASKETREALSV